MTDFRKAEAALVDIRSHDIDLKIRGVEHLASVVRELTEAVVDTLQDPDHSARYLIFERIGWFGSLAIAPLEGILRESSDEDTCLLAAAALAFLGSRTGEAVLLDAVRRQVPESTLAARALASVGAQDAATVIIEAVRHMSVDEVSQPTIDSLLSSLQKLGVPVPEDILDRLRRAKPAWLRRGWAERYIPTAD